MELLETATSRRSKGSSMTKGVGWAQARVGQGSEAATEYGVRGAPTYFLIGPDVKIVLNPESDWGKWTTNRP
jgi:hypothetical protein